MAVRVAWRGGSGGDLVERRRRVSQRLNDLAAERAQRLANGTLLVHSRVDHDSVEEVADHIGRRRCTCGHRRAERNPLPLGVSVQQQAEGEGADHERRDADGRGETVNSRADVAGGSTLNQSSRMPRVEVLGAIAGRRLPFERQPELLGQRIETVSPVTPGRRRERRDRR